MTFDLISGLHMQIQTWHPPLRLCIHAEYYVKSGLTNVLKNANKTKNMYFFSIRVANYIFHVQFEARMKITLNLLNLFVFVIRKVQLFIKCKVMFVSRKGDRSL